MKTFLFLIIIGIKTGDPFITFHLIIRNAIRNSDFSKQDESDTECASHNYRMVILVLTPLKEISVCVHGIRGWFHQIRGSRHSIIAQRPSKFLVFRRYCCYSTKEWIEFYALTCVTSRGTEAIWHTFNVSMHLCHLQSCMERVCRVWAPHMVPSARQHHFLCDTTFSNLFGPILTSFCRHNGEPSTGPTLRPVHTMPPLNLDLPLSRLLRPQNSNR